MAQKVIGIKLEVDVTDGNKLVAVTEKLETGLKKVVSGSKKVEEAEKARVALQGVLAAAQEKVIAITQRANEAYASGARGANLGIVNVTKAVRDYNKVLADTIPLIRALEAKIPTSFSNTKASSWAHPASGVTNSGLMQQPTRVADDLARIRNFNAATEAIEREAAARRNFNQQAENNRRLFQTAETLGRLEAQEANYARYLQDLTNRRLYQVRTNNQQEVAYVRGSIAEQQALYDRLYRSYSGILTQGMSRGARFNSSSLTAGMSSAGDTAARNAATRENSRLLNANSTAAANNERTHRSLFVHIGEAIGAYRVWNTAINIVTNSLRAIPRIGIELDSTVASLTSTFGGLDANGKFVGSLVGMGSAMAGLSREAVRTGIPIGTLRETFRSFQASTSLAGESLDSTWHMFTNLNTVITGLHLPADKANGVFLAMAQIFNKTKVQSEELVKQLGNLLPGAFASFAAANKDMFKDSADLIAKMKNGVVFAHDTVEKFTQFLADRFAPAFEIASQSLNANIGRMQTSFTLLGESIYNSTSGAMVSAVKSFASIADYARGAVEGTNNFGTAVRLVAEVALGALTVSLGRVVLGFVAMKYATMAMYANAARLSVGMYALRASFAFLASPAVILAGLVAIGLELRSRRKDAQELRDAVHNAFIAVPKVGVTREEKLKIMIEESPTVKTALQHLTELEDKIDKVQGRKSAVGKLIAYTFDGSLKANLTARFEAMQVYNSAVEAARLESELKMTAQSETILRERMKDHLDIEQEYLKNLETLQAASQLSASQFDERTSGARIRLETIAAAGTKKDASAAAIEEAKIANTDLEKLALARTDTILKAEEEYLTKSLNKTDRHIEQIKARVALLKADTANEIGSLEANKNLYQTNANLNAVNKTPLRREDVTRTLYDLDLKILAKKKQVAMEVVQLQESSLKHQDAVIKNQVISLTKAYGVIQKIESATNNKRDVSPTGALGTMQVQPSTLNAPGIGGMAGIDVPANILTLEKKAKALRDIGQKLSKEDTKAMADWAEANSAIIADFGRRYYEALVKRYQGDLVRAAAAYNGGFGNEDKGKRYPETRDYVEKFKAGTAGKNEEKELQATLDLKQAKTELVSLENEASQLSQTNLLAIATLEQERIDTLRDIKLEVQAAQGNTLEVERQKIILAITERKQVLQAQGNREGILQLNILQRSQLLQANINDLEKKSELALANIHSEELSINIAKENGLINQQQAAEKLIELKLRELEIDEATVKALAEQAAQSSGNLELANKLLAARNKVKQDYAGTGSAQRIAQDGLPSYVTQYNQDKNQLATDKALEVKHAEETTTGTPFKNPAAEMHQMLSDKKLTIDKKYAEASLKTNLNLYSGIAGTAATTFEGMTTAMVKMYGAQSKQARMAFAAYKAASIAQVVMTTATAVMAQLSNPTPYVGFVLAGLAAALGAVQLATVISQPMPQAHAGLDYVPENNQTYLLSKGERVLAPQQNKDLTNALQNGTIGNQGNAPQQQNIRIINAVDPSVFNEYLGSAEGERVIVNIVRRNQG